MSIRPNIPSIEDMYINAAVMRLAAARNHLQAALYLFDDAGFEHDPTARAYSFVAGTVAEFNGRPWRTAPTEPAWIADAAVAWRADRARRSRR